MFHVLGQYLCRRFALAQSSSAEAQIHVDSGTFISGYRNRPTCKVGGRAYSSCMAWVDMSESLALIALLKSDRRVWSSIRALIEEEAPSVLLRQEIRPTLLDDEFANAISDAARDLEMWTRQGITVTTPYSDGYPSQLRAVHDYPPILFARGKFLPTDRSSVAVVGTRQPSRGALDFVRTLVPLLVADGRTIVSGLAKGVDTAAMAASLEAGNRTIGIIGTGLNRYYPRENQALQEAVAREHLLLSQFWPDAPPTKQSFPMRNHVMSAFSGLTLIVEASENSGTRIQARAATKHGRPLVITRAVYMATNWAKELVRKKLDVTVVSSASEAAAAVRSIIARQDTESAWIEGPLSLAQKLA